MPWTTVNMTVELTVESHETRTAFLITVGLVVSADRIRARI
jgi:hypothetical protein